MKITSTTSKIREKEEDKDGRIEESKKRRERKGAEGR